MRIAVALTTFVLMALIQRATYTQHGAPPHDATDISRAEILAAIKKAPADTSSDQQIRVVDIGGYNVAVGVVRRPASQKEQGSLSHTKMTEIYYVLEGSGTLVTGGTIPNGQPLDPTSFVYKTAVG